MTTKVTQECGCVINVYSDGSAGGAEIGEWCDLHRAASDMRDAIEVALIYLEDGAPKTAANRLRAAFEKAKGGN